MSSQPEAPRVVDAERAPAPHTVSPRHPAPEPVARGARADVEPAPGPRPAAPGAAAGPARSRRPIVLGVAGAVVLALLAFGVQHWLAGRDRVSTDNAQIEGDIIPVLSRVGGYVAGVDVVENQQVAAGQRLVQLDDRDLRARLAQADADLASAKAQSGAGPGAGMAEAQAQAARDAVTQARANATRADRDLQRYRNLAGSEVISRQQLDAAEAAATAARAQLAAAQAQAVAATAGVRGAAARVVAAQAARDQAALQESYAQIVAPAAGVVSRKSVEVGEYVQPGQPLMSVVPLENVWVVANLKETELRGVRQGQPVDIDVDTYPGVHFHGTVESVSPATGARFSLLPPDNATGNFTKVVQRVPVRIRVDSRQDPLRPLRPGMSVRVHIQTR